MRWSKKVGVGTAVVVCLLGFAALPEQITIRYAHWNALPEDPYNYVEAFEQQYPQYKVDFSLIPEAEYPAILRQMARTGTLPDVLCLWEHDIVEFAEAGYVIPLDQSVALSDVVNAEDFIPAVHELMELQGGLYGLPWCYATHLLYYNKDLFDKAGIPYPDETWTWQDFVDAARALTDPETGIYGCDAIVFHGIWFDLIGAFGDPIIDEQGRFALGGCAERLLEELYQLTKEGVMAKPATLAMGATAVDLFAAGRAAMAFNGSWMTTQYKDITNFAWDIAPNPLVDGRRYAGLHTGFFAINAKSKVKDAAWKFVEFCLGEEAQNMITRGATIFSARASVMEKGQGIYGPKGPTNWEAARIQAENGHWGYLLFPSTLWMDTVEDFYLVMLGDLSPSAAVQRAIERAQDVLDLDKVAPYAPCAP
jgi:multiple sugar transport system substrate-binding protein